MSTSIILLDQNSNSNDVDIMVFQPCVVFPPCRRLGGGMVELNTWSKFCIVSEKGADLEKQNCLFGVNPVESGKLTFFSYHISFVYKFCKTIKFKNALVRVRKYAKTQMCIV